MRCGLNRSGGSRRVIFANLVEHMLRTCDSVKLPTLLKSEASC